MLRIPSEQMWKLEAQDHRAESWSKRLWKPDSLNPALFHSKYALQTPALCQTPRVPGNTKINSIIVPEGGEKDTEQKITVWSGECIQGSC